MFNVNFDRLKIPGQRIIEQNYNYHLGKLESLRQKTPQIQPVSQLLQTAHRSHRIAQEYRKSEEQRHIDKERHRLHRYVEELQINPSKSAIWRNLFTSTEFHRLSKHKTSEKALAQSTVISAETKNQIDRQNNILCERIKNIASPYSAVAMEAQYEKVQQVKQLRKNSHSSKTKLQKMFQKCLRKQDKQPYVVLQPTIKPKSRCQTIEIKLNSLPICKQHESSLYTLEIFSMKKSLATTELMTSDKILGQIFTFRLKKQRNLMPQLTVQLKQYRQNNEKIMGEFRIVPGTHRVDQLLLNNTKATFAYDMDCQYSWVRPQLVRMWKMDSVAEYEEGSTMVT